MNASLLRKVGLEKTLWRPSIIRSSSSNFSPSCMSLANSLPVPKYSCDGSTLLMASLRLRILFGSLKPAKWLRSASGCCAKPAPHGRLAGSAGPRQGAFYRHQHVPTAVDQSSAREKVAEIITNSRIPSRRIVLELDEKVYSETTPDVTQALNQLIMMGIQLAG